MQDKFLKGILGLVFIFNIIIINLFPPPIEIFVFIGYLIFGIGAFFYIFTTAVFFRKGTDQIIANGIYGIIRHPLFLGVILMYFSHILLSQNWIVLISTIIAIISCYLLILSEEQQNIEKFGEDYKKYMLKTPRINFIIGIVRMIQRKRKNAKNARHGEE